MTLVVTGSRDWKNYRRIEELLTHLKPDLLLVGDCPTGADPMAFTAAKALGIKCAVKYADWRHYGLAAGPMRNRVMLDMNPDLVLAFHENIEKSKGTKDCYEEANRRGLSTMLITN